MTDWTLDDKLKEFDFDNGGRYVFCCVYNIQDEYDIKLLDINSDEAGSCVESLGLSYDIRSRHYSTVVDGDRIANMVRVEWTFWRNDNG